MSLGFSSLCIVQVINSVPKRPSFVTFFPLFQARGGSGEYVWGSSDITTATVNFHGQITTNGPGRTNVTAADAKNAAHTGSLSVLKLLFISDSISTCGFMLISGIEILLCSISEFSFILKFELL